MKNIWVAIAIISFVAIFLFFRLTAYEPLGISISTYDTNAFIAAGHIPFFSLDFFVSDRPATIAVFYKLLEPVNGYRVTALSSPAEDIYQAPAIQPGLDRVAVAQGLLSVIGWVLLAVVVARRLANPGLQTLAGLLILAFGFSPSMTEWDFVMLSEPISLSLFVVLLAISIELAPRLISASEGRDFWTSPLLLSWFMVLIIWVFARDTNAYLLPILSLGIIVLLFVQKFKGYTELPKTYVLVMGLFGFILIFLIHNFTFQKSDRWINPFFNNIIQNVLPYPDRVAFFENMGMPFTNAVWALRDSSVNENKDQFFMIPELMSWTMSQGTGPYIQFLLAYPSWTLETLISGVEFSFSENRQPFFFSKVNQTIPALSYASDLLHPKSSSVVWVALIEVVVLGFLAIQHNARASISLFALFGMLFIGEILMLFVSILGDASSVVRHAIGPVTFFRLTVWLLPMLILDVYSTRDRSSVSSVNRKPGHSQW